MRGLEIRTAYARACLAASTHYSPGIVTEPFLVAKKAKDELQLKAYALGTHDFNAGETTMPAVFRDCADLADEWDDGAYFALEHAINSVSPGGLKKSKTSQAMTEPQRNLAHA